MAHSVKLTLRKCSKVIDMHKPLLTVLAISLTAACAPPPPASLMDRHARLAAAAELASRQCAGYAGGYQGAAAMRADADRNLVIARDLGATPADLDRARTDAQNAFNGAVIWGGIAEACNALVGEIAWNAG